jgi:heme exporter protein CcmD
MIVLATVLITMGKYGWYVWPSYAVALGVIVGLAVVVWRSYKNWQARLAALEAEDSGGTP